MLGQERMTASPLERYRIERLLGEGAAGAVHLARDISLDRDVALKMIRLSSPRITDKEETRARFLREARLTARLQHPNIVVVYEFGEDDDKLFLAMEYVPGGTLAQRLAPGSVPLPLSERLLLGAEVAEAMAHAHEKGVLHRDLKPANILLTADGDAKVSDFGIGKLLEGDVDLTGTGEMVGSPAYMSPEQMRGERLDTRSDIFGFGVVLFHLLTGRKPFDAENLSALVAQIQSEPTPDIFAIEPGLPRALGPIVEGCLAKAKGDRYVDARSLAAELRALVPAAASDHATSSSAHRLRRTMSAVTPAVGTETVPASQLEPTKVSSARAAEIAGSDRRPSRDLQRRAGHLVPAVAIAAAATAAAFFALRSRDRPMAGLEPAHRRVPVQAPPAPVPTAVPTPTPEPAPEPTPGLRLGFGEPVSAASRTLGRGAPLVTGRRTRLETGKALTLRITPGQARLFLDGRFIGVADDWNGVAPGSVLGFAGAGTYRLRVTYPGRSDLLVELAVRPKGAADAVLLKEELPEGTPSGPTGPKGVLPPPDYRTAGPVRFDVEPRDALVTVDGKAAGPVSRWESADLRLPAPGVHEVRLSARGREPVTLRVLASPLAGEPRATVRKSL